MKMQLVKDQQIRNWTIIETNAISNSTKEVLCKCFCGREKLVKTSYLRDNSVKATSCGCKSKEKLKLRKAENNPGFKHGMYQTRIYRIWAGMLSRCTNPKDYGYSNYGGRGITVCERWMTFLNFLEDMKEPEPKMTLDRIDGNDGYYKDNCRWATYATQSRNRRSNLNLEYKGSTKSLMDWSLELNINYQTLYTRIRKGMSVQEAFEK